MSVWVSVRVGVWVSEWVSVWVSECEGVWLGECEGVGKCVDSKERCDKLLYLSTCGS